MELYNRNQHLDSLTLIREQRQGTTAPERPPLTLDQLLGVWEGEAITLSAQLRQERHSTWLEIRQVGDRLQQTLTMADFKLSSTATIHGSILRFDEHEPARQVLLLADGASAMTPLMIPRGQPFLLEAGWLLAPDQRQRLIRSYDDKGGWIGLTLVTERKIA